MERGEKLESIRTKSVDMLHLSTDLRKSSEIIKNIMWWKNARFWIILGVAAVLGIYIGMVYFCGGFALKGCFGSSS